MLNKKELVQELVFVLVLLVSLQLVFADASFTAEITPNEQVIQEGQIASFHLRIRHSSNTAESFDVFSSQLEWDIMTRDPLFVPAGKDFETLLNIRPIQLGAGLYNIPISVRLSKSNEEFEKLLGLEIQSAKEPDISYVPSLRGNFSLGEEIDPRQSFDITVSLQNKNKLNISRVAIKVRSNTVNKDYETVLNGLEKKH